MYWAVAKEFPPLTAQTGVGCGLGWGVTQRPGRQVQAFDKSAAVGQEGYGYLES